MKPLDFATNQPGIPVFEHKLSGPIDLWMHTCWPFFGLAPTDKNDAENGFSMESWFVDPITIAHSRYPGMVSQHSNWHVEESGNLIHVHRYVSGRASIESSGLPAECEAGAITLLDFSRPFTALNTNNDSHSFYVPHSVIGYTPSDALHAPVYSPMSMIGRLIGEEMDNLLRQLKNGARAILSDDVNRFLGCVAVGMSPDNAQQTARAYARASLKRSIKTFIEARLSDLDLSVTTVLHSFGVSRASLYRMFEAEDGVRNYINRRRLYRAVTNLAENPLRRGQIHDVAELWGFSSDASFNRMVRREFGVAPGALFEAPINPPINALPISIVHEKMNAAAQRDPTPA